MAEFYWDWTGDVAAEEEVTADKTGDDAAAGHAGERGGPVEPPFGLKTGDIAVVGELVAECIRSFSQNGHRWAVQGWTSSVSSWTAERCISIVLQ